MTYEELVARGRARTESRWRATVRITRPGVAVWDPETLQNEATSTTVYEDRGRIRAAATQASADDAADQAFTASQFILSIPVDAADIEKGDVVECLADPSDAALVGRKFIVVWPTAESDATARRIPIRETR